MERSSENGGRNEANTLFGASLLNVPLLADDAYRLWAASADGWAQYQIVPETMYQVKNDTGGAIRVGSRILHQIPGTEDPAEFNGWYVGTVAEGQHKGARLLLSPDRVLPTEPNSTR